MRGAARWAAAMLAVGLFRLADATPVITQHPVSVTTPPGTTATLTVQATGSGALSHQWFKDSAPLSGAVSPTLTLSNASTGDGGDYVVTVTDSSGTTTSRLARVVIATPVPGRIENLSVRAHVGPGASPLIAGFFVSGGAKPVLIRAVGPGLAQLGVNDFLPDPHLEVHADIGGDQIVGTNDSWADAGQSALEAAFASTGAFTLDPASLDAALIIDATDGRTVHVAGPGGSSGVVLAEVYDRAPANGARLVNVSARHHVGTGDAVLIAGFSITGNEPRRVLVRGVGPTLAELNVPDVLADPLLEIHTTIDEQDVVIAANDNWSDEANAAEAAIMNGPFALPRHSTDAALLLTLPAGVYTAIVRGANGATGEALAEVYEAPALPPQIIPVLTQAEFVAALASAGPGDEIVLADGNYQGLAITNAGTAEAPITIRAAHRGKAVIDSGVLELAGAAHVTIDGLRITTAGESRVTDGESYRVAVLLQDATQCRITRCTFALTGHANNTHWVLLGGAGEGNRIDHCSFGPNTVDGCHYIWPRGNRTIAGVTPPADRTAWAEGSGPYNPNLPRHTLIDHNHFFDHAPGTAEAIVLGGLGVTGDYQDLFCTVEWNLFENCDGDPEIISVKSSSNVLRYNTVRTSVGMFSLRAGNHSSVHGNFFLQEGKSGAGGIKLYERDHTIYNNTIVRASEYSLLVGGGDSYDPAVSPATGFSHAQSFRARIVHNTVIAADNRPVIIGHGSTDFLPPVDLVFANNLITGSASTLFNERIAPTGAFVYAANLIFPNAPTSPATGFTAANPLLDGASPVPHLTAASPAINAADSTYSAGIADDADGQTRADPDIGADEFSGAAVLRGPLTSADVGPDAP